MAHAVVERPAVAAFASLCQHVAGRRGDDVGGRFAFEPVAPFVFRHELLGGFRNSRIVALAHQVPADPAGEIPVASMRLWRTILFQS